MQVLELDGPSRTTLFKTLHRKITTGISVLFTDTPSDPRIGSEFLDYRDACQRFFCCSYHYVVRTDGAVEIARDPKTVSTRGRVSLHHSNVMVAVVGGRNEDGTLNREITPAQLDATEWLIQQLANALQTPLEISGNVAQVVDAPDDTDEVEERNLELLDEQLDEHEFAEQ